MDDAEKIAMVIDTQAQLSGLRQASQETVSFVGQVESASGELQTDLNTATAALNALGISAKVVGGNLGVAAKDMAKAEAILGRLGASAKVVDATLKQTATTTAQLGASAQRATAATAPLNDAVGTKFPGSTRSAALAAARLSYAFDGMGGGITGVTRSLGTLSYGLSSLSPDIAAIANPIAAAVIALGTLAIFLERAKGKAEDLDDVFKNHLANLNLSSARAEMQALDAQLAELQAKLPDASQKFNELFNPTLHGANTGNGFFADFWENTRHQLTLTTAEEEQYQRVLKEREALQKSIAEQGVKVNQDELDHIRTLTEYAAAQLPAMRARITGSQAGLSGDALGASEAALTAQALSQEQAIRKEYTLTTEQWLSGLTITAQELKDRQMLLANLHEETALQDQLLRQQDAARKEQATSRVVQAGTTAQDDLEGPSAKLNAARIRDERDYTEAVEKEGVNRSVARKTQLAEDERAERDYYDTVRKAQAEYYKELNEARGGDGEQVYYMETVELQQQLHEQVMQNLISEDQERTLLHARELTRDKSEAASAIDHPRATAEAAEAYGGDVAEIGKTVSDSIRRGELAWNAYKDLWQAKALAAKALAMGADGNIAGAILMGAASAAMFGAAAFEVAGALSSDGGGGGSSAGASGGGALNTSNSTFSPTDSNKSGGQVIIIQTVNPNDKRVISATQFYLNQQQVLKVPMMLPPSPAGYAVKQLTPGSAAYTGRGY